MNRPNESATEANRRIGKRLLGNDRPISTYVVGMLCLACLVGIALSTSLATALPDLRVSDLQVPAMTITAGERFDVLVTTRNDGAVATSHQSMTGLYLSPTPRRTSDVIPIGSETVPPLAPDRGSSAAVEVEVPALIPAGSYYVLACADALSQVVERNERNNCRASRSTIRILPQ